MTRPSYRAPQFKGHSPLVIAAFALTAYVLLSPGELRLPAKRQSAQGRTQSSIDSLPELDSSVLLDSIVSLVQNYYVDSGRVNGQMLVLGTMRSLAYALPDLKFHDGLEEYSLSFNSETISFTKNDKMSYDDLLGHLKSLSSFCDRIQVSELVGPGENIMLGSERDSTSIVVNALLSSLDAHSSLLSSDAYQDLRQGTEGAFGGLGVIVGVREHVLTVLKPLPRSPAVRMGVKEDDKIIAIDGHSTFGVSLDKLVSHMRGAPGTKAELLTLRPGDWAPRRVTLEREMISVDSVEAFEHHRKNLHILHLSVENFASRTAKEIRDHIKKFRQKYPVNGLVLDLRNNPGGLLDQAVHVSDIFLDNGVLVTTRGRREEVEKAQQSNDETDYPIVVLMNEDSASASEIVAGALQDNGRAVVVGQPSFGKGSVQTVFELPEQRALKLTIARYYTPANKSIQNIGITPDVWIQPVFKDSENSNLFGSYRYRNEQFLPNHLTGSALDLLTAVKPAMKGYYLSKQNQSEKPNDPEDPSLKVALAVFGKLSKTYGQRLPEGSRRATHWTALSRDAIKEILDPLSSEATNWLKSKHSVSWRQDIQLFASAPELKLEIRSPQEGLTVAAGDVLDVPWRIVNESQRSLDNLSVFIQSPVSGLETKELLIGRIEPNGIREGTLKLRIPFHAPVGRRYVNAGIAIDAQALPAPLDEFIVNISEREPTSIVADLTFRDGATSIHENILEAGERASVAVVVGNKGSKILKNLSVALSNLGGRQLVISSPEITVSNLLPGEQRTVEIPVSASNRLESSLVSIGVAVRHGASSDAVFAVSDVKTSMSLKSAQMKNVSH